MQAPNDTPGMKHVYVLMDAEKINDCHFRSHLCDQTEWKKEGSDKHSLTFVCDPQKFGMELAQIVYIKLSATHENHGPMKMCEIFISQ